MIMDAIYSFLAAGLQAGVDVMPTCAGLGFSTSGLSALGSYVGSVGLFVDLTYLSALIALVVAVEAAMLVPYVALWVYHQFWGSN